MGILKSISSTNLIERAFLEEKRRSKVLPRFFDNCLKLVFASLMRASRKWNRLQITFEDRFALIKLRRELGQRVDEDELCEINDIRALAVV